MRTKTLMLCLAVAFVIGVAFANQLPRTLTKLTGGGPDAASKWTVIAMQTPGEPALSARLAATNSVLIYWASSETTYHLVVATNMTNPVWATPAETVQDDNTNKFILMTPQAGLYYFQLEKNQ
jgi:hypothetical protein